MVRSPCYFLLLVSGATPGRLRQNKIRKAWVQNQHFGASTVRWRRVVESDDSALFLTACDRYPQAKGGQCWLDTCMFRWCLYDTYKLRQHQCPKEKSCSQSSDWRCYVSWGVYDGFPVSLILVFRISLSHFARDDDDLPKNSFQEKPEKACRGFVSKGGCEVGSTRKYHKTKRLISDWHCWWLKSCTSW